MTGELQAWMPLIGGTLPIVVAILIAAWLQNRRLDSVELSLNGRIDDTNRRIDDLTQVLRDIQATLKDLDHRLTDMDRRLMALEERGSPIIRQ